MKKIEKIGVQLYSIRDFMKTEEEIRESFKKLKDMGYDQAQAAGFEIPYDVAGQIAKEEGIEIVGNQESFKNISENFDETVRNGKDIGTFYLGVGGYRSETPDGYREFTKQASELGEKLVQYGGRFTYHNHSHEFGRFPDGTRGIDILIDGLDPKTTSFVLDTYWVQHAGASILEIMNKLDGRIDILHLKDKGAEVANQNTFITEIGNGNINWFDVIETAQKIGVKYYVVEQDTCPGNPFDSLKMSIDYLRKNFM